MERTTIAIVGAGIGGATLAAALARHGVAFTLYEQAANFTRVGAGIQLTPNLINVLNGIGVGERLREFAFRPRYWRSRDAKTADITFEIELGAAFEARYGTSYLVAHRADLHRVMSEPVPLERVRFGKKLVALDRDGSATLLSFTDGSQVAADFVIGADGVHSVVRAHLLGAEKPRYTGNIAYRSVLPAALLGDFELDDNTKWWADDRHIVIYFLTRRRDEVYFVTGVPEPDWTIESWSTPGDLRELRAAFADFHATVRHVVGACPSVQKWALLERDPLHYWSKDSITLLGDACHAMLPYMGQGGAMAIEDAAVLARCLAETGSEGPSGAFRRYEATRKERADHVLHLSRVGTWLRDSTDPSWLYGYNAWTVALAPRP